MTATETALTVASALQEAAARIGAAESRLLLGYVLNLSHAQLVARSERALDSGEVRRFAALIERRGCGEPIAYILEEREFYGLGLRVTPDVLIPRPETELLVDLALERVPQGSPARVLELGTGSGAIAVALAHERPGLEIVATDISPAALAVARDNAQRHRAAIRFVEGDWFAALDPGLFDLIVSNPPYVADGDPHLVEGDLRFEPMQALVGAGEGLGCLRTITAGARSRLAPGGWLLLEHGYDQGPACESLLRQFGYEEVTDHCDLAGLPRACAGRWAG